MRFTALDQLRGIAIIGMLFSGLIPHGGALPAWMYHAQLPPPTHQFNPLVSGLTWVDLVFPFFLFAMGAALPLAQKSDLKAIFLNFLKLWGFAVAVQHIKPFAHIQKLGIWAWILSIIGFLGLCALLVKPFENWTYRQIKMLRAIGLLSLLGVMGYMWQLDFSLQRNDVILLILAQNLLLASLIYHFTSQNPQIRWYIMGGLSIIYLLCFFLPQVANFWGLLNIKGFFFSDMPFYLIIVLSGVWAGEVYLSNSNTWINDTYKTGFLMLLVGILCSFMGMGIKKDPVTLSYLWVSSALSLFTLIGLHRLGKSLNKIAITGQNPMMAYIIWACLLLPILQITQLHPLISGFTVEPILGLTRAIFYTLLSVLTVAFLTQKGIIWKR